ncbi:hypothetical protein HU200_056870 [Digitaria exilis]|uniref:Major facilitator superfamily (MFS) profile domain-containing protein n=1 Tax=Digitaria exilis TaxID=1010633 RepID=A0A835AGX2_9POAL|nr:hypothetical protein HU200_056870 [Digitaria exilis]
MLLHLLPLSCALPRPAAPTAARSSGCSYAGGRPGARWARRRAQRRADVQPETPPRGRREGGGGHDPHGEGSGGALLETVRRLLLAKEEADAEGEEEEDQFPKRWAIVFLCFSAFLLCNMDRVNMSIAILPMSAENGWNPQTVGLIQSSFFWGYLLTQIAGGIWADTVGGKTVLGFGVVWWSIATALTPVAAKLGLPFLLVVRAFMGIGEGVAMPAMNNILSKWVPVSERSRSLALVYSGMYLGSVTGLAFSPLLIHKFGWPSVFYSFGSLGAVWFTIWATKVFCFQWSIEFYFPLFHIYFHLFQIMQSIGFLGPAFFLTQLSHVNSPAMAVLCMACSQGTDAFSQSGLYSNHQDIGPRYAGVLLGLSNTAGVLAGVFGTAATGYILQHGSWDNVFEVSVVLYLVGTLVWNVFSTGEKILD